MLSLRVRHILSYLMGSLTVIYVLENNDKLSETMIGLRAVVHANS
jgi:hypothetical protein